MSLLLCAGRSWCRAINRGQAGESKQRLQRCELPANSRDRNVPVFWSKHGATTGLCFLGFLLTLFVVIVLVIRWQIRYRDLITEDADYKKARRSWWISLALLLGVPVIFVVRVVIEVLLLVASGGGWS